MNAITQIITQQLGGSAARTIAQRFGISETTANTAIQMAVPLIRDRVGTQRFTTARGSEPASSYRHRS